MLNFFEKILSYSDHMDEIYLMWGFFFVIKTFIFILHFAGVYVYVPHVCSVPHSQRRVLDPWY